MKSAIIHAGQSFDWEAAEKFQRAAGSNMAAAFYADPGVMTCPGCGEYLWNEGDDVECPVCHRRWQPKRRHS